jgi:glycosyltransferase involved in cell wall biosynthesis
MRQRNAKLLARTALVRHDRAMPGSSPVHKPSISLVIPAYNEENYLPACLDAVMQHVAGKAMEVIVVDNNSTDGTRAVVERYPAVRYVFEPRKGITRARQCGFLAATGDILAYVDADTHPPAGWIEQIWDAFAADGRLACLSGPYSFYDLSGLRNMISNGWFVVARPLSGLTGYLMVGGNFAIRRDVLEKMGGFDSRIEFYGEDVDIAKRARPYGKVRFSPRFVMPTSGRRMQKEGFARSAGLYFANFVSIALRGKPATKGYNDIR